MLQYTITLPRPRSIVLGFLRDGLPGVATINSALYGIEHPIVFRWHLSVLVEANVVAPAGLPDAIEQGAILDVQTQIAQLVEADGQAVWLARHYHDATWELLWRVHDARQVQAHLNTLIDAGTHLRPFSYKLQDDPAWLLAREELDQAAQAESN